MDQSKYLPKEEDVFQMREKYGEKQRGKIMDLGGGQADNWMVVSIQASVSSSIGQFLQNLCLL